MTLISRIDEDRKPGFCGVNCAVGLIGGHSLLAVAWLRPAADIALAHLRPGRRGRPRSPRANELCQINTVIARRRVQTRRCYAKPVETGWRGTIASGNAFQRVERGRRWLMNFN